uniref:Putative secreted protein n=2 Tax=Triatoma infestans TaxID=30076 RepID=A6YPP5_TRIIF|nr:putative secreted protein [Triatoma infestans]
MVCKLFCCLYILVLFDKYCIAENEPIYGRVEHYEQFDDQSGEKSPNNWHETNHTAECKNWFQNVMEFFFGEADEARGHPGGLFTRMVSWIRKGICRMNGTCPDEQPNPTPDFPSPALPSIPEDVPPTEPDAEVIPDETNDVQ